MPFPVHIAMIEAAETALGVAFPRSYRVKMLRENGGAVVAAPEGVVVENVADWTWELVPFYDTSTRRRLSRTCNDVVRETRSAQAWAGFPEDGVVIGSLISGDLLLLRRSAGGPELDDAIYWWDHETRRLEKIADDFSELREA